MSASAFRALADPLPLAPHTLDHALTRMVLDRLQRAVIVVDGSAVPHFANDAAATLLRRADAIMLVAGRLTLASRRAETALVRFLSHANLADGQSAPEPLILRVARNNGLPPYQLVATRLDGAERPTDGPSQCFVIFVFEPHECRAVPTRILVELYGLSRAEARLAAKLFQCCSLQETARSLNISLGTAKTHLKHIFAKCEVRSQAELLQLLALGARID